MPYSAVVQKRFCWVFNSNNNEKTKNLSTIKGEILMKSLSFPSVLFLIFFASCNGSKVKGKAVNAIDNSPLPNVIVTAVMNTNIEEDKSHARLTATTNSSGDYVISGLLSKYDYMIFVSSKGYTSNQLSATPPENNKTLLLNNLAACIMPPSTGVFVYENSKWRELNLNKTCSIFDKTKSPFYPTRLNLPVVTRSKIISNFPTPGYQTTEWISGELSQKSVIQDVITLKNSSIIGFVGNDYSNFIVAGLYFFPSVHIFDANIDGPNSVNYPGDFMLAEGYYAGVKRIRGTGLCCRRLDIDVESNTNIQLKNICDRQTGQLHLGVLTGIVGCYYSIYKWGNTVSTIYQIQ
jgi:hypothetical protein